MTSKKKKLLNEVLFDIYFRSSIRGQLCAYLQTSFYLGVLSGYIGGTFMDYHVNPLVMATIPLLFLVIFWFIPSSPQHLLKNDQIKVINRTLSP